MGRKKTQEMIIEDENLLRMTFKKRCVSLIKKAYELGVLCQVDVALLVCSPSGRLIPFNVNSSIEDVIAKYINLPDDKRGIPIENKEHWLETLERAKLGDETMPQQEACSSNDNTKIEELQAVIARLEHKRQVLLQWMRKLHGDHDAPVGSLSFEQNQHMIQTALAQVKERKNKLMQELIVAPPQQECTTAPPQQEYTTSSVINQQGTFLQPHSEGQNTDSDQEDPCTVYLRIPDDDGTITTEASPNIMENLFNEIDANYDINDIKSFNLNDEDGMIAPETAPNIMEHLFKAIENYNVDDIESLNLNDL